MEIENVLDTVWGDLSASGQAVIDKQGVAYTDGRGRFGDEVSLVVRIVSSLVMRMVVVFVRWSVPTVMARQAL